MSAVNWTQRARDFLKTSPPPTDETDERGVLSVLSVRVPPVSESRDAANEGAPSAPPEIAEPRDEDPDRWCWPHGEGMNAQEIERCTARLARFAGRGIGQDEAERLADMLMRRDRDGDDRRMCLECSHLGERGHCLAAAAGRLPGASRRLEPVPTILQGCEAFGLRKGLA